MVSQEVTIINKLGLHARPAAMLVKTASKFASDIYFKKDGLEVNGKSIMGVMMLAAEMGSKILVVAKGPDEKEALAAVTAVFATKFGEE
ncbi:MAG: HPr family phosphocarrier protein [candidate division Zixibacteria bacterium]|nr:HPr family phosphocarrier protein [candidate division Zixibacteria bacterium]